MLWIDGICINQRDDVERSQQVTHMQSIYRQATGVIFWLGKASAEVQVMMQCLQQLHSLVGDDHKSLHVHASSFYGGRPLEIQQQAQKGTQTLLQRPWFSRVWILQEVANARTGTLCAGSSSAPARLFAFTASLFNKHTDSVAYWQPVLDLMIGSSVKQTWWSARPDLYTLLMKFPERCVTDEKDKVYGLLGLSQYESDREAIKVDYTKPLHEVYQDVFRHCSQTDKSRVNDILNLADSTPALATLLVVVQRDTGTGDILRKMMADDQQVPLQDIPFNTMCPSDAHIFCQQLAQTTKPTLYSEVMSMLIDSNIGDHERAYASIWRRKEGSVKLLIMEHAGFDSNNDLFEWAASHGLLNIMQLLIDIGLVDLQATFPSTCRAVEEAVRAECEKAVVALLDIDFDANGGKRWNSKNTGQYEPPLAIAASQGNLDMMKLLLDRGADVDGKSPKEMSSTMPMVKNPVKAPLSAASEHWSAVQLLLEHGAEFTSEQALYSIPCFSFREGDESGNQHSEQHLSMLLKHGADPNRVLSHGLHFHSLRQTHVPVRMALESGANANEIACECDQVRRAPPLDVVDDHVGHTMIQLAARCGSLKEGLAAMRLLLEYGADPNLAGEHESGKTALNCLLEVSGSRAAVECLLEKGARIDLKVYEVLSTRISLSRMFPGVDGKDRVGNVEVGALVERYSRREGMLEKDIGELGWVRRKGYQLTLGSWRREWERAEKTRRNRMKSAEEIGGEEDGESDGGSDQESSSRTWSQEDEARKVHNAAPRETWKQFLRPLFYLYASAISNGRKGDQGRPENGRSGR